MQDIGEAFGGDHRRLEEMLLQSAEDASAGKWQVAGAIFTDFRRRIERHMTLEEQVLFPAVEIGKQTPLTEILRKGHRDLRVFMDELDDALEVRHAEEFDRIAKLVSVLLSYHDKKEEEELYPVVQKRLGAEVTAVIEKLDR